MSTAFSCRIEIPNVEGLAPQELTVGREFLLVCEGPWTSSLQIKELKFDLPKELEYQIKLQAFQFRNSTIAEIKVVSYLVAEHKIQNLKLTDGKMNIELGTIEFSVVSVLPKREEAAQMPQMQQQQKQQQQQAQQTQQPQSFASVGPVYVSIPWQYFFGLFLVLALVGSYLGYRWFLRSQRKALAKELAEHDSAMTPVAQFHHSLRKLRRENVLFIGAQVAAEMRLSALSELENHFRLYLTRRFRFPANRWSDKQILRELKSEHAEFAKVFAVDLAHLLKEFGSTKKAATAVPESDVIQISKEITAWIEKADAWKSGGQ